MNLWSKAGEPFTWTAGLIGETPVTQKCENTIEVTQRWILNKHTHLVFGWVWQIRLRNLVPGLTSWWRSCRGEEWPNCPHTFLNKTQQADATTSTFAGVQRGFKLKPVTRHRKTNCIQCSLVPSTRQGQSRGWCGGTVQTGDESWFLDSLKDLLVYSHYSPRPSLPPLMMPVHGPISSPHESPP